MSRLRTLLLVPLLAWWGGCSTTARPVSSFEAVADPFGNPGLVYRIPDGGTYTYSVDDRMVLTLSARNGRLYCNEVDTGPYDGEIPVRILSESELSVGRERRPIPASSGRDVRARG